MPKKELSESETSENSTSNSEEEPPINPENAKETEYEKQRQSRIAENKARMELLGLHKIANSLMGSPDIIRRAKLKKENTAKSKKVVKEEEDEDDDDYKPNDDEDCEENDGSSDDFEESLKRQNSKSCSTKVKNEVLTPVKRNSKQKMRNNTEFMYEDEALKQAIALSLKDAGGKSDLQRCGSPPEGNTKKRKKKSFVSRVQMTEDDLVIHFCQLDEVGRGNITLRDLRRMAAIHDFAWTDKELVDMIHCFNSDTDGKLSLDDFRNIVQRCNMLQGPENP